MPGFLEAELVLVEVQRALRVGNEEYGTRVPPMRHLLCADLLSHLCSPDPPNICAQPRASSRAGCSALFGSELSMICSLGYSPSVFESCKLPRGSFSDLLD